MFTTLKNRFRNSTKLTGILRLALFLIIGAIVVFGVISAIIPVILFLVVIEMLFWAYALKNRAKQRREKVIYGTRIS